MPTKSYPPWFDHPYLFLYWFQLTILADPLVVYYHLKTVSNGLNTCQIKNCSTRREHNLKVTRDKNAMKHALISKPWQGEGSVGVWTSLGYLGWRVVDFLWVVNYNGDGVRQKKRELGWILNTNLGWETKRKSEHRKGSKGSMLKIQASRKQKFNTGRLRNIVQKTLHTYLPLITCSCQEGCELYYTVGLKSPYWNWVPWSRPSLTWRQWGNMEQVD
jgi:hypothetical protein